MSVSPVARKHLAALRRRYLARPTAATKAAYTKAKRELFPPRHVAATRLSPAGAAFIAGFEGFVSHAYQDAVGVWTIGYGHTGNVRPGEQITKDQALQLLRDDATTAQTAVLAATRPRALTQNQLDALVSFVYNVGAGAFRSSTLLQKLNAGDKRGAADEFLKWDKAGGRVLAGLTARRQAERKLFLA